MTGYSDGDEVLSGWRIVGNPIGAGAFGRVYEVRKVEHGIEARSALKVVSIPPDPSVAKTMLSEGQDEASVAAYFGDLADELAREIALLAGLSHPGIVTYHDHAIVQHGDGMGWDVLLRMELLKPLTDFMGKSTLPQAEIARLGAEVADALAYCHKRDVVHRDVKPSNVFVDPDGRYKLGDFGVARTAKHTMGALSIKGTPDYMAPEAYRGDPYGPSADVCSLGVMLYQLLNGNSLPFLPPDSAVVGYRDRERAVTRRLLGEPAPALAGCDPALADAVLAACSPDPGLRPSAAELHSLLGGLVLPDNGTELLPDEQEIAGSERVFETQEHADSKTIGVWPEFEVASEESTPKEEEKREAGPKAGEALHSALYQEEERKREAEQKAAEALLSALRQVEESKREEERRREEEELKLQEEAKRKAAEAEEARKRQKEKRNETKGKVLGWIAFSLVFVGLWLIFHFDPDEGELLYTVHQGAFIFFALVAWGAMALVRFAWGKLSKK